MSEAILVINSGSSSLKFSVFVSDGVLKPLLRGQIEAVFTNPHFIAYDGSGDVIGEKSWEEGTSLGHEGAIEFLFRFGGTGVMGGHKLVSAGHRVVHGGTLYREPVLVDDGVIDSLENLVPLAPLHQPYNIAAIRAVRKRSPGFPQVACFDTSFHHTQTDLERTYAIPRKYTEEGVRRYGFHGLSYEYISSVLKNYDRKLASGRVVIAHLGNGASMCAVKEGKSVATTMGFTAVCGLPMGTRSGTIDPGILVYMMDHYGMDARGVEDLIYNRSGLLGVSEVSSDMRTLLASDDPRAKEAVELFIYRIGRELGSLAAALGGLDGIVFTAGIGENAAYIREMVCKQAGWLGVELDKEANDAGGPKICKEGSRVSAWVIPTNEELVIATHTKRLLKSLKGGS
ncbi:MAG: acetate/propionate family kinase [Thermodesulfobacteriota bacterium]